MLQRVKINDVVKKAASAALKGAARVQRVLSEPTVDSTGQEALRIIIVLKLKSFDKVSGDGALSTLVGVNKALRDAHEERFPIIEFAAEEELEVNADP